MSMHFNSFDDEHWDEFKWEAHLNEVERKSEQLRKFIASNPKENLPRWLSILKQSKDEDDAFEAYVEEELLMDEAYFPEDEDDWEDEDDEWDDEDFLFGLSEDEFSDYENEDEIDDFDEGEEWKSLSDDYLYTDFSLLEDLSVFDDGKELAIDILKWIETIPGKLHNQKVQTFVDEILKIAAKIAGGHSFGYEQEYIGANIAYSKKALHSANNALNLMQVLKKKPLFTKEEYREFHARLFELRNDIGIYIQELRDQFHSGLE